MLNVYILTSENFNMSDEHKIKGLYFADTNSPRFVPN